MRVMRPPIEWDPQGANQAQIGTRYGLPENCLYVIYIWIILAFLITIIVPVLITEINTKATENLQFYRVDRAIAFCFNFLHLLKHFEWFFMHLSENTVLAIQMWALKPQHVGEWVVCIDITSEEDMFKVCRNGPLNSARIYATLRIIASNGRGNGAT